MAISPVPRNFKDIVDIVANRAKIALDKQEKDLDFVKGTVNEYYTTISNERSWQWTSFDRTFNFQRALNTGTVSVTNGSRQVTFTGLVLVNEFKGRSLKIKNQRELYRIIGIDINTNTAFLEANFVGDTDPLATFKLYQYEFPLPPDCDIVSMVHVDDEGLDYYGSRSGELENISRHEFNRAISNIQSFAGPPYAFTVDGDYPADALPPLDVMILDYDFLGGNPFDRVKRIRFLPIEPDRERVIHINYSRIVEALTADEQVPLMPIDDRWVLVHFAMAEWYAHNGAGTMSDREFSRGERKLAEMRQEWGSQQNHKFIFDGRIYRRQHRVDDYRMMHKLSRLQESF